MTYSAHTSGLASPRCGAEHCITCSDEGVPMRVDSVDEASGLARCFDASGAESDVMIALVPGVQIGDWLLVHAATALNRLELNRREAE